MKKRTTLARALLLTVIAFTFLGCGRGKDFTVQERADTAKLDQYPRFSKKPVAATQQFTDEEKQKLTTQLVRDAKNLKSGSISQADDAANAATTKEDAKREAEETLRQIEQSGQQ